MIYCFYSLTEQSEDVCPSRVQGRSAGECALAMCVAWCSVGAAHNTAAHNELSSTSAPISHLC